MQEEDLTIVTWNINGIRSFKESVQNLLDSLNADIICLQETKVTRDQINSDTAVVPGYNAYFSFSQKRSGYSGVVTYCRKRCTPFAAEEGLTRSLSNKNENSDFVGFYGDVSDFGNDEILSLDNEGRAIITHHNIRIKSMQDKKLAVINVYCPRADPDDEARLTFKLRFYELLKIRAEALLQSGSHVIILGDINTSHKEIDHCDPSDIQEFASNPGRKWLDKFLAQINVEEEQRHLDSSSSDSNNRNGGRFVDTFRYFFPARKNAFTCWQTLTSARLTNYGTRLDYIFADVELTKTCFKSSDILPEVEGSDHCPVKAELNFNPVPNVSCPSICSKNWLEFSGKQQKLSTYFCKRASKSPNDDFEMPAKRIQESASQPTKRKKLDLFKAVPDKKQQNKSILSFFNSSAKNLDEEFSKEIPVVNPVTKADTGVSVNAWKKLLKAPPPAPLCKGHNEPCILQTVKKQGANYKRQFFVCSRPVGHASNSEARCNFFQWSTPPKINSLSRNS